MNDRLSPYEDMLDNLHAFRAEAERAVKRGVQYPAEGVLSRVEACIELALDAIPHESPAGCSCIPIGDGRATDIDCPIHGVMANSPRLPCLDDEPHASHYSGRPIYVTCPGVPVKGGSNDQGVQEVSSQDAVPSGRSVPVVRTGEEEFSTPEERIGGAVSVRGLVTPHSWRNFDTHVADASIFCETCWVHGPADDLKWKWWRDAEGCLSVGPRTRTPRPIRRLRECVELWPDCTPDGYDPRCCRFPKSCSCTAYDIATTPESELESVQYMKCRRCGKEVTAEVAEERREDGVPVYDCGCYMGPKWKPVR